MKKNIHSRLAQKTRKQFRKFYKIQGINSANFIKFEDYVRKKLYICNKNTTRYDRQVITENN